MKRLVFVALIIVLAVAGLAAYRFAQGLDAPYRGFVGVEQFVDIPPGIGPAAIGRLLVDAGVVADPFTWRVAVWRSGDAPILKAGEYRFTEAMTPAEVIRKIARGEVYLR